MSEARWCLSPLLTMVYHKCLGKTKQSAESYIDETWEYVIEGKILCHTLNDCLTLGLQPKIQKGRLDIDIDRYDIDRYDIDIDI